jgi:hypothetical protein
MEELSPEKRLETEKRLDLLAKKNGQTPEERLNDLAQKVNKTPEEQWELVLRVALRMEKHAEKLNADLQEGLKTSTDKWKTVEEFAKQHGMKRTNRPFPKPEQ